MTEHLTAGEAGEQLDRAASIRLASDRDRRIHGLATAGFGVLAPALIIVNDALGDSSDWRPVLWVAYSVAAIGLALWQTRAAATVPRHAKRLGYVGLALTVVAAIVVSTVLNTIEDPGVPLLIALILVAGAPLILAGVVILRGSRR